MPKKSIVLTPTKMAAYYADHALENEIHPLLSIFKVQSNEQISRLYQDLGMSCLYLSNFWSPNVSPYVPGAFSDTYYRLPPIMNRETPAD